jgi:hypothetical protein
MFTDRDYLVYFEQIAALERLMIYHLHEVLLGITDVRIKQPLEEVLQDEKRHYAYVRGMFDSILFKSSVEKRAFLREHLLGVARLKLAGSRETFEGYFTDISPGGAAVEFDQLVSLDGDIELWLEPFDNGVPQHFWGKAAWSQEISPRLQVGKIKFRAGVEFTSASF